MIASWMLLALLNAQSPVLLDGVAAQVGRKVVTRSDVEAEARILLVRRVGERGSQQSLDDRFLRTVLDYVIVQELLAQHARREGVHVAEVDVDRDEAAFQILFSSEDAYRAFLSKFEIGRDQIRSVLRRDGAALELLRKRRELSPVTVSDDRVDAFLAAKPDFAANADQTLRRQASKRLLIEQGLKERLAALVQELKLISPVRAVAWQPHDDEDPAPTKASGSEPASTDKPAAVPEVDGANKASAQAP